MNINVIERKTTFNFLTIEELKEGVIYRDTRSNLFAIRLVGYWGNKNQFLMIDPTKKEFKTGMIIISSDIHPSVFDRLCGGTRFLLFDGSIGLSNMSEESAANEKPSNL